MSPFPATGCSRPTTQSPSAMPALTIDSPPPSNRNHAPPPPTTLHLSPEYRQHLGVSPGEHSVGCGAVRALRDEDGRAALRLASRLPLGPGRTSSGQVLMGNLSVRDGLSHPGCGICGFYKI